jgi:hypothetical protein
MTTSLCFDAKESDDTKWTQSFAPLKQQISTAFLSKDF